MKTDKLVKFIRINIVKILAFTGFTFLLSIFPSPNVYFQSVTSSFNNVQAYNIVLPDAPPIPVDITGVSVPYVTAEGLLIVDIPSNMVIYQKNADTRFKPASTTKLMTALVALDHYQLDDVLTVDRVETVERTMGLVSGEKITFEELLYGTLVHSANDAAFTIAQNYPGGVEKFVEAMNQKAGILHLDNTHFTNPIGFDDDQIYTTAKDLAKLAKVALNNKIISKIVGTRSITVHDVSFTYFHDLSNVNALLGKIPGVAGLKTGYTQNGGEILVTEVLKNNRSVLFVLLKSEDRFKETTSMINWVFDNFTWKNIDDIIPASQKK